MPITYPYTQYGGIWKLNAASAAQGAGTWPVPPLAYDPYFYDVTMLLPGNGANGAQNNTFLDSSSNALTINRNSNTTQGTFSPYGNLWSNYFDGSSYLTFPEQTFSGDFTIEFWFYQTAKSSYYVPAVCSDNGGYNFPIILDYNGSGYIGGYFQGGAPYGDTGAKVFSLNTWTHIAVSRSGSAIRYFVNGSLVLTMSGTTTLLLQKVGGYSTSGFLLNGYLSNVRVTNTALYTSNFTPSTTPLTAVSGTSLLTCQSNRFIDNSSNNFTLTVNGTPSVQRFSPFNPTESYSAATIGGSGYFDGSGDYLTATSSSLVPSTTSTPFTLEAWIYPTTSSGNYIISSDFNGSAVGYTLMLGVDPDNTNAMNPIFGFYGGGYGWTYLKSTSTIKLNTWTHLAAVFTGSTCKIFINGVLTDTGGPSSWIIVGSSTVKLGMRWDTYNVPYYFTGYMSDARITMGTAVYSSTFTPPTAPIAPVTNTKLLTNFTNAGIPDAAMMNDLETVGNAQISTAQSKFGGSSMYFDGSGDYLTAAASQNFNFGTGDFTIEFWINRSSVASYPTVVDINYGTAPNVLIQGFGAGLYAYVNGSSVALGDASAYADSTGTWYHYALVRSGSTVTWYRNGIDIGHATYANNIGNGTVPAYIGGSLGGGGYYLNGYIDDLRITKGYARYTTNFTPPTYAFQTY